MHARGLTLIEVVASLLLVGPTVTSLLVAVAGSFEQLRTTRQRETASVLAGELITQWKLDPTAAGAAAQGRFESHPAWRWVRVSQPCPAAGAGALNETTLRIYQSDEHGNDQVVATYTWLEKHDDT